MLGEEGGEKKGWGRKAETQRQIDGWEWEGGEEAGAEEEEEETLHGRREACSAASACPLSPSTRSPLQPSRH